MARASTPSARRATRGTPPSPPRCAPTDPALLHYRSGAFYLRARPPGCRGSDPLRDVLLGLVAAADEPIAGGRHKVFGHPDARGGPADLDDRLPPAAGGRAWPSPSSGPRKLGVAVRPGRPTAIVVCSFGDASVNHSTRDRRVQRRRLDGAYQGLPVPLLFVCEDNGIGISVRTPPGWVAATLRHRPGLRYFAADGTTSPTSYDAPRAGRGLVRATARPAFLHLRTVRLMGHAGSDVESRLPHQCARSLADLRPRPAARHRARCSSTPGCATPDEVLARTSELGARVRRGGRGGRSPAAAGLAPPR